MRFADDILILATSQQQLQTMLQDLSEACGRVGLKIHWGKTKMLSNIPDESRDDINVTVDEQKVQLIGYNESTPYLGRAL